MKKKTTTMTKTTKMESNVRAVVEQTKRHGVDGMPGNVGAHGGRNEVKHGKAGCDSRPAR